MLQAFVDLIFPAQCAACRAIGTGLCANCVPHGMPVVVRELPTLTVYGLGEYRSALRSAVLAVKNGRRDVARALGERLSVLTHASMLLVPVRTTRRRRRVRGIDGVEFIARASARMTGATVRCAIEPVGGDAQRGRTRDERLSACGRFWCDETQVFGRAVTLVDDVCTTGSTLEDCAKALRSAGASVTQALVVAVAND